MAGLVQTWVYVVVSCFVLWVLFALFSPILSFLDQTIFSIQNSLPMSAPWTQMYLTWAPILRDFFGYISIGMFVGLVIYLVLTSARVEPTEYRW